MTWLMNHSATGLDELNAKLVCYSDPYWIRSGELQIFTSAGAWIPNTNNFGWLNGVLMKNGLDFKSHSKSKANYFKTEQNGHVAVDYHSKSNFQNVWSLNGFGIQINWVFKLIGYSNCRYWSPYCKVYYKTILFDLQK